MFKVNADSLRNKAKDVTAGVVGAAAMLAPVAVFAEGSTGSLATVITADSISGVMTEIT